MRNGEKTRDELAADLDSARGELNRLNETLATYNDFLAIVSHDIRSPVISNLGLLDLITKTKSENLTERQLHIIEALKKSGKNLLSLIESLSTLTRILRNKLEVIFSDFTPDEVIEPCIEKHRGMADGKNIELAWKGCLGAVIRSDKAHALEILNRLVTNAVWFTEAGGAVEVTAELSENTVSIIVKDNGVGIEPNRMEGIFSLSTKDYTTGTSGEKGAGLGLCISRSMACLIDGALELESEPGKGATARLSFEASQTRPRPD